MFFSSVDIVYCSIVFYSAQCYSVLFYYFKLLHDMIWYDINYIKGHYIIIHHLIRVMRAILGNKSASYNKIIANTGISSSHLQVAQLASRIGFKGKILSQAATTIQFKLFGHIARHPESLEHKIIYRSCHSLRSRSSPYRVSRPGATGRKLHQHN